MALPQRSYHLQLHRYQLELGIQNRRQWGRTETAEPTNQSLSKHRTPSTAKQPPLLLLPETHRHLRTLKTPKTPTGTTNTPTSSTNHSYLDRPLADNPPPPPDYERKKRTLTPQGKESAEPHPICRGASNTRPHRDCSPRSTTTYLSQQ